MGAPPDEPLDEAGYGTLVEETFIAERGTPFLLSSKDWQLIRAWREGGIPASTVVRAVKETFEKRRSRGAAGKISSISYCAGAVEELWEMERRGLVGSIRRSERDETEEVAPRLEALCAALRAVESLAVGGIDREILRKGIEKAVSKIEALPREGPFEETEEKLLAIEASLVRGLEKGLDAEASAAVQASVGEALGEIASISPGVVSRMRAALTRREVRRRFGLPALTLL